MIRLMLATLLCTAVPALAADPQVIDVKLDSYSFIPDRFALV